ncbi:MAG: DUF357 domain-containing protein [Candidatus Methanomethyliales bacterium]|nr:DUF357 domain-containing protein [Candidatus Methanomethylicales archaeon]
MDDQIAKSKLERYIKYTQKVLTEMAVYPPDESSLSSKLQYNLSLAKQYFEDSKYYFGRGDFITGLVCIAYCEGLLDACRNFGWLKYEWNLVDKD